MDSSVENLLNKFEKFEVDEILNEVKEWGLEDGDIREFGEALLEERRKRRQLAQAAQAARHTYVQQHWNPGCYPQITTAWYIRGLDFCWTNWHHQFKRPRTPPPAPHGWPRTSPPAPPPSPEVQRKRGPPQSPSQTPSELQRKQRRQ